MKPPNALKRAEWEVRTIPLATARDLVQRFHYARGGANTATFRHGLFRRDDPHTCYGAAWWIPPTKSAALATWPADWRAVLALSRLAIHPDVPTNGASFLLGQSVRLIRRDPRWQCLVTYADEWQQHTGAIYRAANWTPAGRTTPEATWVDPAGRMVARKAGPTTRTKAEMEALGYRMIGRHAKAKFVLDLTGGRP